MLEIISVKADYTLESKFEYCDYFSLVDNLDYIIESKTNFIG
jgi:hypothetical protein